MEKLISKENNYNIAQIEQETLMKIHSFMESIRTNFGLLACSCGNEKVLSVRADENNSYLIPRQFSQLVYY